MRSGSFGEEYITHCWKDSSKWTIQEVVKIFHFLTACQRRLPQGKGNMVCVESDASSKTVNPGTGTKSGFCHIACYFYYYFITIVGVS